MGSPATVLGSATTNQHILSKQNLNGQDKGLSASGVNFNNNNRISKANLKDYGMSIITGGKTPAGISGGAVTGGASKMGAGQNEGGPFGKQVGTPLQRGSSEVTREQQLYKNEIGGLIEVKTAPSNYKKAKNTISTRLGEEYEADKPMHNYNGQQASNEAQRELKTTTTETPQQP